MRDAPDAVMLFAAGFGTRMRPLTDDRPKPLIEVAGRPLIAHALDHVRAMKPHRIVANAHYRAPQLAAYFDGAEVEVLTEAPTILDMGGGLRNAAPALGAGTVWTMNPDVIWKGPNPLGIVLDAWQPERMEALLLCVPMARALERDGPGDFTLGPDGALTPDGNHVYGGVQIIKLARLLAQPAGPFPIQPLWEEMRRDGTLFGAEYPGQWCDVGHPAGIATAEALLNDV